MYGGPRFLIAVMTGNSFDASGDAKPERCSFDADAVELKFDCGPSPMISADESVSSACSINVKRKT